jgi:hypothetical protein
MGDRTGWRACKVVNLGEHPPREIADREKQEREENKRPRYRGVAECDPTGRH